MIQLLKQGLFPVLLAALWLAGCHSFDKANNKDSSNILDTPPLAAITDSIRQFPKDAALYFRRAELLSRNNFHELAYADYKKSWELDPVERTALRYASNLSIIGKSAEAVKLLEDCVGKFPASLVFKRLLGEAYADSGRSPQALDLYDNTLRKDPLDFEAWYEKGLLLEQVKDTAGAIDALKKAYTLQPVSAYGLELAHLYAERKNPISLKICDDVIGRDSSREMVDPFFIKGIYYSNTGHYAEAIDQFDSCMRRDWKFTDAYIEKGIAFFKQKNYDEALHTFHMAATVSNTFPDAYYWIGRCYEAIHKKDEAIINYKRAIALDRKFTEAKDALKRVSP
ncbi:MAG TPA: tetratricopeptide repeat protein [Puia sp.]|nr:tetratricopeptide repeat protein [Puia sp.]